MALIKYFRSDSKCSFENSVRPTGAAHTTEEMMIIQEKVFDNPVILPVILKHVLQNGDKGTLCTQTAKTLRLVSRAWLLEVNLLFRKSGEPLMFLTTENFQKFLASTSSEKINWVPPLSLSLSLETISLKCITFPRSVAWMMGWNPRLILSTLALLRSNILMEMRLLKLNIIPKDNLTERNTEELGIFSVCINLGSGSLEELELGIDWDIFLQNSNLQASFHVPKMVNLTKLKIVGAIWRLDPNSMEDDFRERLPKLEELEFRFVFGDTFFEEWCHKSVFWNVRSLKLALLTDLGSYGSVQFSKENMEQVLKAFPRVVHLQLGLLDPRELDGLKYMFGQLGGQLRYLHIVMGGEVLSEDDIDGLIIGAGPEIVKRLKREPALRKRFLDGDLIEETEMGPSSIRDLKLLETLILQGCVVKNAGQGRVEVLKNLPSDLAFELGFMQLPALHRYALEGSFGVSEEMADKWYNEQRRRKNRTEEELFNGWVWSRSDTYLFYGLLLVSFIFDKIIGWRWWSWW